MCVGILIGICTDVILKNIHVQEVEAATTIEEPKEVQIEVIIDWTPERIKKEIRDTFPEQPELAIKIAQCESGLVPNIQSHHKQSYGRERSFSIFQVHEPDWGDDAIRLGLNDWKTDPAENIKLARYIYEKAGNKFTPWSCYTKKMI